MKCLVVKLFPWHWDYCCVLRSDKYYMMKEINIYDADLGENVDVIFMMRRF